MFFNLCKYVFEKKSFWKIHRRTHWLIPKLIRFVYLYKVIQCTDKYIFVKKFNQCVEGLINIQFTGPNTLRLRQPYACSEPATLRALWDWRGDMTHLKPNLKHDIGYYVFWSPKSSADIDTYQIKILILAKQGIFYTNNCIT